MSRPRPKSGPYLHDVIGATFALQRSDLLRANRQQVGSAAQHWHRRPRRTPPPTARKQRALRLPCGSSGIPLPWSALKQWSPMFHAANGLNRLEYFTFRLLSRSWLKTVSMPCLSADLPANRDVSSQLSGSPRVLKQATQVKAGVASRCRGALSWPPPHGFCHQAARTKTWPSEAALSEHSSAGQSERLVSTDPAASKGPKPSMSSDFSASQQLYKCTMLRLSPVGLPVV